MVLFSGPGGAQGSPHWLVFKEGTIGNEGKDPEKTKSLSPPSFRTFPHLSLDFLACTPEIELEERKDWGSPESLITLLLLSL